VSSPANGNFVLEFPDRRQVWLPRMRQRVSRGEFERLAFCQCWGMAALHLGIYI